jgi:hypothetical protein
MNDNNIDYRAAAELLTAIAAILRPFPRARLVAVQRPTPTIQLRRKSPTAKTNQHNCISAGPKESRGMNRGK